MAGLAALLEDLRGRRSRRAALAAAARNGSRRQQPAACDQACGLSMTDHAVGAATRRPRPRPAVRPSGARSRPTCRTGRRGSVSVLGSKRTIALAAKSVSHTASAVVDIDRVGSAAARPAASTCFQLTRRCGIVHGDVAAVPLADPQPPLRCRTTRGARPAAASAARRCAAWPVVAASICGEIVAGQRHVPDRALRRERDAVGAVAARRVPHLHASRSSARSGR